MAIDVQKWEAARAKRGLTSDKKAAPVTKPKTYLELFPAKNRLLEIAKLPKVPVTPQVTFGLPVKKELPQPKLDTAKTTPQQTDLTAKDFAKGVVAGAGVLGKGTLDLTKEVVQGTMRGYAGIGSAVTGKTLTPTGKFQEAIYGTNEPLTAQRSGEELPGVDKGSKWAAPLGFAVASIDLIPGGNYIKALSKANKTADIIRIVDKEAAWARLLPKNEYDDFIESLRLETDTKKLSNVIDEKKSFVQQNKDALVKQTEDLLNVREQVQPTVTKVDNVPASNVPIVTRTEPTLSVAKAAPEVLQAAEEVIDITKLPKTKREALEVFPEKQTQAGLDDLNARTRGKVSWDEAKAAAQQLGWTEEKMINFPKGKAFSDTELMASRGISKNADDTLSSMEARLMTLEKGSPEYLTQSQEVAIQRLKAFKLKTVVVGASSEAGRALSSLRANVEKIDFLEKKVAKLFNDPKTPQNVKDYIQKMVSEFTGTPEQFAKLLRDTKQSSVLDMMIEFATAIKLTGIPTHIVNTITGTAMIVMRPIERAIAATINKGESLITGAKQQRFYNDAVNDVMGQATGWKQGGREALNAIIDEDYAWRSRPLEDISLQGPAIKGKVGMNRPIDIALNVAGKVVRLPYRLLGAEDLLIRQPAKMGEFYTSVGRLALDKGYTPGTKEYNDFFAATLSNPTAEIVEQITKAADRVTFQDELSPGLAKLQQLISNEAKAVRFIVPFFKTIINLQKRALEYSPMAPLLPSVRTSLKASPEVRADALARMALGTAVITPLVYYALDDNITLESPKNPAERDAFFASGKQAYSIKVGDNWIPFNRLSPFSEWFVTAGLLSKAIKNEDEQSIGELTTNTFFGLAANLFDKSFATGMADLLDALRGSEKERESWFNNFVVGSTLPVLSGNIARTVDPTLREVNSLREAYMSRIPGLSDNLPARNDVFGKPISRAGSAIERAISPVIPTQVTADAVREELDSLGITMGFPEKSVGGFEMTQEQYYDYQQIAGKATYSALFSLVSSPQYNKLTSQQKEQAANKIISKVRGTVRTQVAAEQVIMKEIQDRLEKQGLSSEQAKEKAVEVYETLKEKQADQTTQ